MVGAPASGKSTWLKKTVPFMNNTRIISRDEIRFALVAEDEPYFSREDEVQHNIINQLCSSIKQKYKKSSNFIQNFKNKHDNL